MRSARYRRLVLAAAGGLALVAVTAVTVCVSRGRDGSGSQCDAERTAIDTAWRGADRTAITTALRATNVTFADDTATRVVNAIDGYVRNLESARATLCRQQTTARAAVEQGILCLGERRTELGELIERIRKVTAADARYAIPAVHALPALDECTHEPALEAEATARTTPALRTTRRQLDEALRAARAGHTTAKDQQAIDHAKRAVTLARTFGGRLLARALILAGEVSDSKGSEALFREAAAEAERAQADDLRGFALARLAGALAVQPGRELEALAIEPSVTGIQLTKQGQLVMPMLQHALGVAHTRSGTIDKALGNFEAALAAARGVLPDGDPRMPDYIESVALALDRLQRSAEALKYHEEAHAAAVGAFGVSHPNTARYAKRN